MSVPGKLCWDQDLEGMTGLQGVREEQKKRREGTRVNGKLLQLMICPLVIWRCSQTWSIFDFNSISVLNEPIKTESDDLFQNWSVFLSFFLLKKAFSWRHYLRITFCLLKYKTFCQTNQSDPSLIMQTPAHLVL